jgi:cytochrome c553
MFRLNYTARVYTLFSFALIVLTSQMAPGLLLAATTAPLMLPIEVMDPVSTTTTVSVSIPTSATISGPLNLWMQIHGLEYETQASVRVNNGSWIALNSQNVKLQGLAAAYGGIGGGYHTLSMTVALPAGLIKAGTNTVTFSFNQTDGNSSGFRVLAFNVQTPSGSNLISSSQFTQDNPSKWTPPSNSSTDVTAGDSLWHTAALKQPNGSGSLVTLKAHCADCHTQDGRDLKYFNYSNNTIYQRSLFHGLNKTQANQLVTYIRTLGCRLPHRLGRGTRLISQALGWMGNRPQNGRPVRG